MLHSIRWSAFLLTILAFLILYYAVFCLFFFSKEMSRLLYKDPDPPSEDGSGNQ